MQHIIKKQIIELSIDKKLNAFQIQQKVSDYYFARIVPLLQQAFDIASNNEETISIDKLEIELGIITESEIEKGTWEEKVFKNITEQLVPVKLRISSRLKVKRNASSFSISDQWIFYMRHGYLPWNVLQIDQNWYDKVLESFASNAVAITNLRKLINNHRNSARRIVLQNSISFLKSLTETLTAKNQDELPRLIDELATIISLKNKSEKEIDSLQLEVSQKLWMETLLLIISEEAKLKPGEIVGLLLRNNFSRQQLNSKKIKNFLLENKKETSRIKQIIKEDYKHQNQAEEDISKELIESPNKIEVSEEGIYVSNAGIVLLHPFLNSFFKNLHLVGQEYFIDNSSQMKALHLLHYLATGRTKPHEHELVMAKVLCAFDFEQPVDNLVELSEEELKESNDLLLSAIRQWPILKSTSTDGLREGFLQRKGKLFAKNDSLVLQIEQGSIDMLLDDLPWNLNIIKLPWMKDILRVNWR